MARVELAVPDGQREIAISFHSRNLLLSRVLFWRSWRLSVAFAGLLILTALVYVPSLTGEFQFDDTPVIEKIERHDITLRELLRGQTDGRPLVYLTLLANYKIAGLDVRVFHATNFLFHLGTVALVLLFTQITLKRLEWPRSESLAVAVAGLFALHPLQTQAVSYVIQRAEVLASLLYLGTLLLLLYSEPPGSRWRRVGFYIAAVVTFFLGLGAKEIIITVPFVYLLYRWFFPRPETATRWSGLVLRACPLAAIALYLAWASIRGSEGRPDVGFSVPLLPPARYLFTQLAVVPTYLRLLVWPAGQNIEHDFPLSQGLSDPRTLLGSAALVAVLGCAVWLFAASGRLKPSPWGSAARGVPFGLGWFFLLLAPTSSVVPLADVMVEHRVYLASWGLFFSVSIVTAAWIETRADPQARGVAAAILMILIWSTLFTVTWQRNSVWGSRLALWADAARKSPNNARARANHAHALRMAGRPIEAVGEYLVALRLVGEKPSLLRSLASALYESGRTQEAMRAVRRALILEPDDSIALNDLAVYLAKEGKFAEAESKARRALASDPRNALAYLTLGNVRLEQGDPQGALEALTRAEALAPHLGTPALSAAIAHARLGNRSAACADLDRYRRVQVETPQVRAIARELACLSLPAN